jgi:hypothetical protein
MKYLLKVIFSVFLFTIPISAQNSTGSSRMYGVTIDGIDNIDQIVESLGSHSKKMTARIVFNEYVPAKSYSKACEKIHEVSYIMGEILDSYGFAGYPVADYKDRVNEYINTLGDNVDIWEIGNESNGEWVGNIDSSVEKLKEAFEIAKSYNKQTALTLYYNPGCYDKPENEMFRWINERLGDEMRNNLDYVLVSYYEDDCNNFTPDWQKVFDSLYVLFPNSKLGIGECGTKYKSRKAEYIKKYYNINVTTPGYIGGYFWWYYKEDCVPDSKKLWQVLENALNP